MPKELITWNKIYSIGIEKIDTQHKKLIEIINTLFNSFSEGTAENITPEIIKELSEYTQYHFKTEETIFDEHNYPEKENHIQKHKEFIEQIKEWNNKLSAGNDKDLHYELMDYLKKWLTKHITGDDFSYGKYFRENNIEI